MTKILLCHSLGKWILHRKCEIKIREWQSGSMLPKDSYGKDANRREKKSECSNFMGIYVHNKQNFI